MTALANRWPAPVWQALDQLAHLDLSHYSGHVFDRDKFLGTARAKRVEQHRDLIDSLLAEGPDVTAEAVLAACNPAPEPIRETVGVRRDYDHVKPVCDDCGNLGLQPVVASGIEYWKPCPTCNGRTA